MNPFRMCPHAESLEGVHSRPTARVAHPGAVDDLLDFFGMSGTVRSVSWGGDNSEREECSGGVHSRLGGVECACMARISRSRVGGMLR
jgi:hypothetical protein